MYALTQLVECIFMSLGTGLAILLFARMGWIPILVYRQAEEGEMEDKNRG